jgi:predicted transposase YbfD/YdcC
MLELKGAIVSIDAMGCQKEIAKKIVNGGGDYVLAVKDNQPALCEAIRAFFLERHEQHDFRDFDCRQLTTKERSRGRLETRHYLIAPLPDFMKGFCRDWKGLKSIGQVVTVHPVQWEGNFRGPLLHQQP